MASRLQQRLESDLAQCRDARARALLRAERACVLARDGRLAEAESELGDLTLLQIQQPQPALAVWLKLLEGTLGYYSAAVTRSRPAFAQAMALAHQARLRPLIAQSAMWLAQMAFVDDEIEPMVRLLAQALQESTPDQHGLRARVALLIAANYHYAFRVDLAQPWYQRAHHHASQEGDSLTLSALMYLRAWTSGNQCRMASIFGTPAPENSDAIRHALLSAQSSEHFDRRIGSQTLRQLVPVLEAQLLTIQGDWAEADRLFSATLEVQPQLEGVLRYHALLLGDWAWCRWQRGDADAARRLGTRAEAALADHDCAQDDRTVAHGRLAALWQALDEPERAALHAERARTELAVFLDNQQRVLKALDAALRQVVL